MSGQLPALNAIQIDGGIANDVYGVSRTPGEAAGAKSISLEALDQIQVLVAPFDVRQGAFTGAHQWDNAIGHQPMAGKCLYVGAGSGARR